MPDFQVHDDPKSWGSYRYIQKDTRLYDNLYKRIMKFEFKSKQEIEDLIEVVTEVKDIFESHRVDPYLTYLA